jgi:pilus assembly protein Flp/PilA
MLKSLKNVLTNEDGATLVEYGMLVALVAAVSIVVVKTLGTKILAAFTTVNGQL